MATPATPLAPNTLCTHLAQACSTHLLDPKWLLVPSMAIGNQWTGIVARSGTPCVNVIPLTLQKLALRLAHPSMLAKGVRIATSQTGELILDAIWSTSAARRSGYLSGMDGTHVTSRLLRAIEDLREAGLSPNQVDPASFEIPAKGREILDLLEAYLAELEARKLID